MAGAVASRYPRRAGRVTAGAVSYGARGKSGHRRAGRWGKPRRRKPTESGTERRPPARAREPVRVKRWGKSPPATVATRRLAKPRPVQGEAGSDDAARRGTGCAARAVAQAPAKRDGHPRQNPAYRPATEKALATGLFL